MNYLILLLVLSGSVATTQNTTFEAAVLKGKNLLNEAQSSEDYLEAANYFARIAQKETAEWLPLYYQAQSLAIRGTMLSEPAQKDEVLNQALQLLITAKQLEKNSELVALEGFIQMIRLTVDPATRGQSLSPAIFGLFQEALKLDPANPRALLFLGQMHYGTAQFFGTGYEEACGYIQKAYDIFDQKPDAPTPVPDWGGDMARSLLGSCNQ